MYHFSGNTFILKKLSAFRDTDIHSLIIFNRLEVSVSLSRKNVCPMHKTFLHIKDNSSNSEFCQVTGDSHMIRMKMCDYQIIYRINIDTLLFGTFEKIRQ